MLKNRLRKLEKRTEPEFTIPEQLPGETIQKYVNRIVGSFTGKGPARPVKEWDSEKDGCPMEYVNKKIGFNPETGKFTE